MNAPFLSAILTTVALLASFLCLPAVEGKEDERSLDDVTDYLPFFIETVAREYSDSKSVAFDELKNSSFFVKNLDFMRRRLKTIDPQTLNVEERKAFFINIYNILVLDTLSSLTPIPQSLEGISDFEHRKVLNIAKRNYTLSSIKHGILRGNSRDISTNELYFDEETRKHVSVPKDPRILSALYSPTQSGPSLHAFVSDTLEQKLDAAMIRMCEEGVILKGNSLIIVSSVFEDFMSDFAPTKNKLLRWLSECVEDTNKKIALYFAALDDTFMSYSFQKFDTNITVLVRDPEEKKIEVDLYIQSLCSDVSGFFTTQLHPSFEKIKKFIDLNIIVFGKASVTPISDGEDFKFECQNGPLECLGNKIMSCVVEYLPVDIQVPFLTCLLTSPSISKGVKECGKKNAVPTLAIEECSKSIEGSRLLYANGLKTLELEPKLYVVPTITINKVYNTSILRNSLKHFSSYICSIYMDTYQKDYGISTPAGCQVKIEVYIDSLSTDVHKFFDLQLIPTWNRVGHSMDLEIIPYGNTEITAGGDLTEDIDDLPSQMRCPRGPLECYGNIVMSCMAELLSTETQINLFKCMMNKKTASLKGKECADEEGVAWQPIHECIEGSLGSELILRNKNKTESLPQGLSFIPTVTVNKIHNRTFTEWALNDLTALVCDAFLMSTEDQETPVSLPRGCPVRVEIYLEMLCSDTKRFFLKVFHPTWKKLQPLIDLHLVPFGKANVWLNDESKDYEFECQNGPLECQGNKIMSCAVEYLPLNLQVEFIACLFQSRFPSNAGKEAEAGKSTGMAGLFETGTVPVKPENMCSEKLHLPWETLRNCSTSREGSELLFQNGIRTMNLKPALFFVPTITLNRYYDSQALTDSLNNLNDQVCRVYQKPFIGSAKVLTPKGCKLMLEVYFISFSKDSTTFLLRQLLPVWKKFHDEISLELIPIGKLPTYFHNETDFEESCRKSTSCAADLTFACVIKYFKIEVQMELLECSLESGDSLATSKSCTQKYQFSWSKISKCIRGTEVFSLLKQNLYQTRKLRPSFHSVPTILVNGFYDKKELKKSRSDLQRVICNSFYDPLTSKTWKPRRCPVTLEVFIASLCPDTKDFFLHQLQPTWKELSSIMDLRIIPFGKASAKLTNADTNEYEFKCQHGPLECYGNRVMSCIVHHYPVEDQVRMLSCMFSKDYPAVEGRECAEDLNLDWASITACIDKEGASLLYENGIKTERVRPKILFIPTTTVNGLYSKIIGRKSFKNLLGLVCSTYLGRMKHGEKEEILEGCKVPVEVFFHSLDEGMRYFFSEEAEEFWRVFKRIVHIKFLPFKDMLNQESYEDCSRNKCYLSHFLACLTNDETTNLQMEFLACLMSQEDPELGIKPCSKELEVNFEAIDSCTSSSKSLNILQENTESFLKFQKPDHKLPLVVVRKSFLHKNRRLKTLACKNFFGPTPHECLKDE